MDRRPLRTAWRVLLVIVVAVVVCGLVATASYWTTWNSRHTTREQTVDGIPVPAVLNSAGSTPAPVPGQSGPLPAPARVASAIAASLGSPALGPAPLVRIVDAITGTVLYDRGGATPAAPASTAKLLTAAAVLSVHPPSYRFRTSLRVVGSTAYLVGGGDPTLTAAAAGQQNFYPGAARLGDLVTQLRAAGVHPTSIVVDDSLFAGLTISPYWDPEDVPSTYGAAITAVMTDGGRDAPGNYYRSRTPDLAAGHELAAALGSSSLPVSQGVTPATARLVAHVDSAPLSVLVEQMLQESDNVIAEVLARQVALARHLPATFAGAAAAIRGVLQQFGVDVGAGMHDGSGLAASDRVSPASLVAVLRLAAGYAPAPPPATSPSTGTKSTGTTSGAPVPPATQASALIAALPVGGWSGTLQNRYIYLPSANAAGDVRAKTGSITGITTLAGYVHVRSGRLLIFSFDADHTPPGGTYDAEQALDRVITALAACGC